MGGTAPNAVALALAEGRNLDAADVIQLLREVYSDGIGTRAEAQALISFDRSLAEATLQWCEFFAEAVADHVVRRQEPAGIIDENKVTWLISALAPEAQLATPAGIEALLRTLEAARESPPKLAAFVLAQLCRAVIAGEGPALGRRAHFSRVIDAGDVALIARVLHAAGGADGRPVSRTEAEALFDLHDACAGNPNDPAFDDLFFKAIANHLIAAAGHTVAPRSEALAPDPHLAERGVFGRFRATEDGGFQLPPGSAGSTALGTEEIAWLSSLIMRDGRPTAVEHALLALFAQETRDHDPALRRFLEHAA